MFESVEDDERTYLVVKNDEEQFSIWPADLPLPEGWYSGMHDGPRKSCLDYIESVWTDMRPLSLRKQMGG